MTAPHVLLVSIDAVRPEIVINQERYGLRLDTINGLMTAGRSSARGNRSVFPSFTYCAHHSIITGCHPDRHGVPTNKVFDPFGQHLDAWYWYTSPRVPTLWEVAGRHCYFTVNIGWPGSVGAPADLSIPEFWRDTTWVDDDLLSAVCRPQGLSQEFTADTGERIPCGLWRLEDDKTKLEQCLWILRNRVANRPPGRPVLMTTYFASYDDLAHRLGTHHPEALACLQRTDELLGELCAAFKAVVGDDAIVCVISDHGMTDNVGDVNINAELARHGLIEVDGGRVVGYRAFCQRSGGAGLIKVQRPEDVSVVRELLEDLALHHPDQITGVLTGAAARRDRHAGGDFDLIVTTKPGWEIRESLDCPVLTTPPSQPAQHGYDENVDDMRAICVIAGRGVDAGAALADGSIVDVAPTLCDLMGIPMPEADGRSLLS